MKTNLEEKPYNLFLDDVRNPENAWAYTKNPDYLKLEWTVVRNYQEFKQVLDNLGIPEKISYDHDLSDEHYAPEMYHGEAAYEKISSGFQEKTGLDCARYLLDQLEEKGLEEHPDFWVHSMNPVGKQRILDLIESWKKQKKD